MNPFRKGAPLGFEAGDANLYRYAHNGPTDATDPTGLEAFTLGIVGQGDTALEQPLVNPIIADSSELSRPPPRVFPGLPLPQRMPGRNNAFSKFGPGPVPPPAPWEDDFPVFRGPGALIPPPNPFRTLKPEELFETWIRHAQSYRDGLELQFTAYGTYLSVLHAELAVAIVTSPRHDNALIWSIGLRIEQINQELERLTERFYQVDHLISALERELMDLLMRLHPERFRPRPDL